MNSYSQVLIIDELSIRVADLVKMKAGQTTGTEETLTWLADNTAMTLAALSSNSLLDRDTGSADAVSETKLDEMIARTRFEAVSLKHIMRSSQNIASATSPDSVLQATSFKIHPSISPCSSSTVPGARPRAMVYKHTDEVDHSKLARFVTHHLRTLDTERL